ncbi:MAG: Gfo/Idh/MocA family oxidoreductase [Candidatus Eiseniibacteriota bacterium]|nr:MAG: Gfo/Idh/MocA family oxidoreductase [Candidatus Eisenbacteria bacterium]
MEKGFTVFPLDMDGLVDVAVVGCGYWGPNLIRNLVESKTCRKIICCDNNNEQLSKVSKRYPNLFYTTDFEEILADGSINAVLIATPVATHFGLAKKALQAGKHTFVEKPFTTSVEEGVELMELANSLGLTLMVGHTFEYSPPVLKIKELISAQELGTVYYISSTRVNLGLHQRDVSVIWDLAPHDLSMLLFWLEETPTRVFAMGKAFVQKGIPDVGFISLEFPGGVIAHVQVSWLSPSKLRRTTIVGSGKMLMYDDTEHIEKVKIFDKGVDFKEPQSFGEFQLSYRSGDIVSPKLDSYEPLRAEVDHFLACVLTGESPRTDAKSGLRVVSVLEAVERSIRNGSSVECVAHDVIA